MKKLFIGMLAFVCIAGAILTNCSTATEKNKKNENAYDSVVDAKMNLDNSKEEYLIDIENYRKEIAKMVVENNLKIAELKIRMEYVKKETQNDFKKRVDELEQRNKEMQKKMDEYRVEGKDKWEKFKMEFNHDMEELGKAFKDLTVKNVK